ncbi:hypothetical protein D3C78_1126690 [compost metagenome]
MRIAPAIFLEIVAVVTRGRHAIAIQRQDLLRHALVVARLLDGDAPGRAVRLAPARLQLAGGLHQVAAHPLLLQPGGDAVDGVAGGDAVEVHLNLGVLAQLLAVDMQVLVADTLTRLGDGLRTGHLLAARLGTEAPQVEQRLDGEVEGAVALQRQALAQAHQLQHVRRHGHAGAGRRAVEALDQRVVAVGGHLLVDLGEDRLDPGLQGLGVRHAVGAHVLDRVGAAHGRPAEGLQRVGKLAARQRHRPGGSDEGAQERAQHHRASRRSRRAGCSPAPRPGRAAS